MMCMIAAVSAASAAATAACAAVHAEAAIALLWCVLGLGSLLAYSGLCVACVSCVSFAAWISSVGGLRFGGSCLFLLPARPGCLLRMCAEVRRYHALCSPLGRLSPVFDIFEGVLYRGRRQPCRTYHIARQFCCTCTLAFFFVLRVMWILCFAYDTPGRPELSIIV